MVFPFLGDDTVRDGLGCRRFGKSGYFHFPAHYNMCFLPKDKEPNHKHCGRPCVLLPEIARKLFPHLQHGMWYIPGKMSLWILSYVDGRNSPIFRLYSTIQNKLYSLPWFCSVPPCKSPVLHKAMIASSHILPKWNLNAKAYCYNHSDEGNCLKVCDSCWFIIGILW